MRFNRWRMRGSRILLGVLLPVSAFAQVTVSNILVTFRPTERPVQNVIAGNSDPKNPVSVTTHVEKVLNPESGGDKVEPSDDILVSPANFSIAPGGQRAIRIVPRRSVKSDSKDAPMNEVVYRILFSPIDRGFGHEVKQNSGGRSASIRVLTGMGILLFLEPPVPYGELLWERRADVISFFNKGNTHVEIAEGKACLVDDCSPIDRKRVYAGTAFEIKVPAEKTVTYMARTGSSGAFQSLTIEPLRGDMSSGSIAPVVDLKPSKKRSI